MTFRAFARLGVDILALDCDESLTIVQRSSHSNTVMVLSKDTTQFDHVAFEKYTNLGISVAPNLRKFIVATKIGPVEPKLSCTLRPEDEKGPEFEVQLPLRNDHTRAKVCGALSHGEKDVLLTVAHNAIVLDSILCELGFVWQLKTVFPTVSILGKFGGCSALAVLGLGKQKLKAQYKYGNFRTFCELAREDQKLSEQKVGAILKVDPLKLGVRFDFLKTSVKTKAELNYPGWTIVGMGRFSPQDRFSGQLGGETEIWNSRLRCVCGSDKTAVVEWKKAITSKLDLKATAKYERDSDASRVCCGLQLKFDHD